MFNNFNLTYNEILKILEKYNPLIVDFSIISGKFDEDLCQEIKEVIIKNLTKNRKK